MERSARILLVLELISALAAPSRIRAQDPSGVTGERSLIEEANWVGLEASVRTICGDADAAEARESCAVLRRYVQARSERMRNSLREEVRFALRRNDFDAARRLVESCIRIGEGLRDTTLAEWCKSLRRKTAERRERVAIGRLRAMLQLPTERRLQSWVRIAMAARGVRWVDLEQAMTGVSSSAEGRWLAPSGRWRRPPNDAELDALEHLLGSAPESLREDLRSGSYGGLAWAAVRQARVELATAEAARQGRFGEAHGRSRLVALHDERSLVRARARQVLTRRRRAMARTGLEPNVLLDEELRSEGGRSAVRTARHRGTAQSIPDRAELCPESTRRRTASIITPLVTTQSDSPPRVLVASWQRLEDRQIVASHESGINVTVLESSTLLAQEGGPFLYEFHWHAPEPGRWRIRVSASGCEIHEHVLELSSVNQPIFREGPAAEEDAISEFAQYYQPLRQPLREWNEGYEALFSAWLTRLYSAPEGSVWLSMDAATQNASLNILHNHLGLEEDAPAEEGGLQMSPDCADMPYFARAYFAWKISLPTGFLRCSLTRFGYSLCEGRSPDGASSLGFSRLQDGADRNTFERHLRAASGFIETRGYRQDHWSDTNLLYSIPVRRETLRPGTVFIDPHSHTLMVTSWRRETASQGWTMMAVDAQPGGFVTVRRFWEGNFVFASSGVHSGSGFKAWRPIRRVSGLGALPSNVELEETHRDVPVSYEQASFDAQELYNRMDAALHPEPRDVARAYRSQLETLLTMLRSRALVTARADAWFREHPNEIIAMPRGDGVFGGSGAWEEHSTICRDLRLMVALRLVQHFSDRVRSAPERYQVNDITALDAQLESILLEFDRGNPLQVEDHDGQTFTLSLATLLAAPEFLERSYNPNDCTTARWGLESSSCSRRAPDMQRRQMDEYVVWFRRGYGCQ